MKLPLNPIIRIYGDCPDCKGKGHVHEPACYECFRAYSVEELANADSGKFMPCGHPWTSLREEQPCDECEGTCTRVEFVSLSELAALIKRENNG
jgi:hypothetical protein